MREVVNVRVKLKGEAKLTTFWEVRWESCIVHITGSQTHMGMQVWVRWVWVWVWVVFEIPV